MTPRRLAVPAAEAGVGAAEAAALPAAAAAPVVRLLHRIRLPPDVRPRSAQELDRLPPRRRDPARARLVLRRGPLEPVKWEQALVRRDRRRAPLRALVRRDPPRVPSQAEHGQAPDR